jgi:hypothetical protein
MGFKGSGGRYELPHPAYWIRLGFQKGKANSETHVKFTVNVGVVRRTEWAAARLGNPRLPEDPGYLVLWSFLGMPGWFRRIGHVMGQDDHWWEIRFGRRGLLIAREVIRAVRDDVLPAIRREVGEPDLV